MRDQPPPEPIKSPFPGLRVLAYDPLLLTGCPVIPRRGMKRLEEGNHLEPE